MAVGSKLDKITIATMIKVTKIFLDQMTLAKTKYWNKHSASSSESEFYDTMIRKINDLLVKFDELYANFEE